MSKRKNKLLSLYWKAVYTEIDEKNGVKSPLVLEACAIAKKNLKIELEKMEKWK